MLLQLSPLLKGLDQKALEQPNQNLEIAAAIGVVHAKLHHEDYFH